VDKQHVNWVDHAKAIGIVLVVYGHVSDGLFRAGIPFSVEAFRVPYDAIYTFHMPLFFFLSGLFFPASWQRRGSVGLVKSKVDTIVYPYVVWSLIQGTVEVVLSRYTNHRTTLPEILAFPWHPRQQFWFLYALFFVFVVACIAYRWLPQRWRPLILVLAVAAFVFKDHVPRMITLYYLAANSVFFFIGAALPRLADKPYRCGTGALIACLSVFAAVHVAFQWARPTLPQPWSNACLLIVGVISIGCVFVASSWSARRGGTWLALLGKHSLAIFLMHTLFASGVRIGLHKFLGIDDLAPHLVLGTLVGLGGPLIAVILLERWNVQGLFAAPPRLQLAPQR
jgi:fucose 4-O-acetylase-like acetyltransferase